MGVLLVPPNDDWERRVQTVEADLRSLLSVERTSVDGTAPQPHNTSQATASAAASATSSAAAPTAPVATPAAVIQLLATVPAVLAVASATTAPATAEQAAAHETFVHDPPTSRASLNDLISPAVVGGVGIEGVATRLAPLPANMTLFGDKQSSVTSLFGDASSSRKKPAVVSLFDDE